MSVQENWAIDDPRRKRLPPLLRKAWLKLNALFLRRLSAIGMTPDQYTALRWLHEQGKPSLKQKELCALMGSDPNTIASLVKRMEKAGWIKRKAHPLDGRSKEVWATKSGQIQFENAKSKAIHLEQSALKALGAKEKDDLLTSLEKVAQACKNSSG